MHAQAGYAMTAPDPLWHPDNQSTMFDVGPVAQRDDQDIRPRIARVLDNLLETAAGGCAPGSTCQVGWTRLIWLHSPHRVTCRCVAWQHLPGGFREI